MALSENNLKGGVGEAGLASKKKKVFARRSLFSAGLVVFLMLAVIGGVVLRVQLPVVETRIEDVSKQLGNLNVELVALDSVSVEKNVGKKNFLNEIEQKEIKWSKVIGVVDEVNTDKINFLSYSGAEDGKVTVNAVSVPEFEPAFDAVAALIDGYKKSPFFSEVFVPSITRGTAGDGRVSLSFSLSLKYREVRLEDSLFGEESEGLVPVRVPRVN